MDNKYKYTVYENDLKFKRMRNIDPDLAEWHNDSVKENFEKDFDNITARLKECKNGGFSYLDLSRLGLEKVPKFTGYAHYNELVKIKYLFLNDNKLTTCGERLECFANLEVLDISFNNITEITFLPNKLKEFICHNNKLTRLPSHESIEILDCMTNEIEVLGKYDMLRDLICMENKLTFVISYRSLKRLICKQNPITEIHFQASLEQLDCSETKLSGKLEGFPKLNGLICNFTKITDITELTNLESLEVVGCKINVPYFKKLKCLLCNYSGESVKLSNKYKIASYISEGNSLCCVFAVPN